jgi:ABC-type transport system substrate-binding protein
MLKNNKWLVLVVLVMAAVAITACAAPQPEQVVVTVEVQGAGGETMIVTATPDPNAAMATGGIPESPLAADAMVACNPLPEMAYGHGAGVAAPAAPAAQTLRIAGASLADPAAQGGSVYKVGVFEDVTTLNFWAANGPDNTVWNSYMLPPRLAAYALADRTFQFIPAVATELPEPLTEEDGNWVTTVVFRDDVTWSDGTPFTAKDWAFTAKTALDFGLISGNWSAWYDSNYLQEIQVSDDDPYTAKLVYHTKPGLARHEYGTLQAPILSEAYWGPFVDEARAPLDALGDSPSDDDLAAAQAEAQDNLFAVQPDGEPLAGSFLFQAREPGAYIQNETNPDYYDSGTTVTQYVDGTYQEVRADLSEFTFYGDAASDVEYEWTVGPNVDAAVYTYYGSQDAALLALRSGEVDFVLNPLGLQRGLLDQVQGDPNVTVISNSVNGFRYMSFNNRRQPMNNCAFRQAMAVLIDKEFVTNTILQGVAFPLYTFVPEGNAAWYFSDVPKLGQGLTREERVNLSNSILEQAGFSWTDDVKPTWNADGGHVDPGGRLILPDGTPSPDLDLWAPSAGYDPLRSTFAIWIETWAREAGIPVTAQLAGFNVLVPLIFTEQDFDMYILGWSLGIFPDYLNDFFVGSQAVPDGNNAGGYVNPEFDAQSEALLACDSVSACKEISDNLQIILSEEVPYVVLFDTGIIEAYRSTSVEYPFTETLSGLKYIQGEPTTVSVK